VNANLKEKIMMKGHKQKNRWLKMGVLKSY